MSLGEIPEWLRVNPSSFVHAAAAGAEAGLQVARMRQAAEEAAANRGQRGEEHAAEMELRRFERQQQMEMRAEEIQAQREKSRSELQARTAYNLANLGLRQQDLASKESQQTAQQDRWQSDLDERIRHNTATEEISADRAAAMVRRGEATVVEHPELPGVKFLRNPSGAEVRVSSPGRGPSVQLEASGKPKGYSGPLSDPTIQGLMGTNAPTSLVPPPPVQPHLMPPPPDNPNALRMGSPRGTLSIGDPTGGTPTPPPGIPNIGGPSIATPPMPAFEPAPKNKSDRKAGETYMTPKGPHTWTEDGWTPYTPNDEPPADVPDPVEAPADEPSDEHD